MAVNNVPKQKVKVPFLFSALFVFILIHTYVPIVGFYTPAIVYAGGIAVMYVVSFIVMGGNRLFKQLFVVLPLFLVNVLEILHHVFSGQGGVFIEMYGLAQNLLIAVCSLFLMDYRDTKLAKVLLGVLFICCLITAVTTYLGCLAFPNASRDLATTIRGDDAALYAIYMQYNIGGFSFIYTITLLIPILVYLAKNRNLNILFVLVMVIVFIFTIRQSEYTTALILSLIGLLSFFLPAKMERKKIRGFMLLIVFSGILLFELLPPVLRFAASKTESEQVSSRLNDLADVVSGNEDVVSIDSDLSSRQYRFQQSWDSFVNSNLLGSWGRAQVGGHSYFLDTLGLYGVLGLILLIIMYVRIYKLYFKPYKTMPWYGYSALILILAVLQAAINTGNSFPFMCLVLPLFYLVVDYQKA